MYVAMYQYIVLVPYIHCSGLGWPKTMWLNLSAV